VWGGDWVGGGGGETTRIGAKKLILATNGFAANATLLRRYCPDIAAAPYFGALGSTGEAVLWGERFGLRLANMGAYQGYATLVYPQGSLLSWTVVEMGGLLVNAKGERFGDESIGYSGFARDVLAQGSFTYSLFDTRIRDYIASHEDEFRELARSDALSVASSPEEVAARWTVDGVQLAATLERYERAARGETADDFGRRDFGMAPLRPPFVMVQVQAGLFHTQGGLWVDGDARVFLAGGGPLRNLFAGGGAATGVSGRDGGTGYSSGSGLLSALGLGRVAGRASASEIRVEHRSTRVLP
jgi:fumarate reductase flavoprotein subunit